MKFEQINFKDLRFDISKDSVIEDARNNPKYDFLFGNSIDYHKAFKYMVILYDMNSMLRNEEPIYAYRRYTAAELAGFPKDKLKYLKPYEDLILSCNDKFNEMKVNFLLEFDDPRLLMLYTYMDAFEKENKFMYSSSTPKDRKDSKANIESFNEEILKLTDEIFGGREERDSRIALYSKLNSEGLGLRIEDIAEKNMSNNLAIKEKRIKDVEPIVDINPYSKDKNAPYKPKKLKLYQLLNEQSK